MTGADLCSRGAVKGMGIRTLGVSAAVRQPSTNCLVGVAKTTLDALPILPVARIDGIVARPAG